MVKAISKIESDKAAGPSGIVVEMIKAAGDTGATRIRDLATAIIRDCRGAVSLSVITLARVMLWTEATIDVSS